MVTAFQSLIIAWGMQLTCASGVILSFDVECNMMLMNYYVTATNKCKKNSKFCT